MELDVGDIQVIYVYEYSDFPAYNYMQTNQLITMSLFIQLYILTFNLNYIGKFGILLVCKYIISIISRYLY